MASIIIRPTGDNAVDNPDYIGVTPASPTTKYDKVDEAVPDESTTYISSNTSALHGVDFNMGDVTGRTEIITKIVVHMRIGVVTANKVYNVKPKINGVLYPTYTTISGAAAVSWSNYSWEYTTNPATGSPWTWANINSLIAGFRAQGQDTKVYFYLTQYYVEVFYSSGYPHEVNGIATPSEVNAVAIPTAVNGI